VTLSGDGRESGERGEESQSRCDGSGRLEVKTLALTLNSGLRRDPMQRKFRKSHCGRCKVC
jgi:hypothetical protein